MRKEAQKATAVIFTSYDSFRIWYRNNISTISWYSNIPITIHNVTYNTPGDVFKSFEN